jgi:hypothetical protein
MTAMLKIIDDGTGKLPVYEVRGEAKRLPVTRKGKRVSYQHPLDLLFIVNTKGSQR